MECDYAVGLSRMMDGRMVNSERPGHTILEGLESFHFRPVILLTQIAHSTKPPWCSRGNICVQLSGRRIRLVRVAFSTSPRRSPLSVFRNLALSLAAGNATIWKPAPSTSLCSIAVTKIIARVLEENGIPGAVAGLVTGQRDIGEALAQSQHVDLGTSSLHTFTIEIHSLFSLLHRQRSCRAPSGQNCAKPVR